MSWPLIISPASFVDCDELRSVCDTIAWLIASACSPVFDEKGHIAGMMNIVVESTEHDMAR